MKYLPTLEGEEKLERLMRNLGRKAYLRSAWKNREQGREASNRPSIIAMKRGIEPVAELLIKKMEEANSGKAGRRSVASQLLEGLDMYVVAFLGIKVLLDRISQNDALQTTALNVGRALEAESELSKLAAHDKNRFEATHLHLKRKRTTNPGLRRAVFMHAVEESQKVERTKWSLEDKVHTGEFVIYAIIEASGMFFLRKKAHKAKGKKSFVYTVRPTMDCVEKLDNMHQKLALLCPQYFPTIIPPKPWTGVFDGGYHTNYVTPLTLIKSPVKAYLQEVDEIIKSGGMEEVTTAINTMQNTAWQVNSQVLSVMQEIFEQQGDTSVADLPAREPSPLPRCPICGATLEESSRTNPHPCFDQNPEALTEWCIDAAEIYKANATLFSHHIQFRRLMGVCRLFKDYEKIYFPYQMDFRGRVYTVPSDLSPQGSKISKGLLRFAEGKPLGSDEAVRWFFIHGANTWGEDKVNFDQRVAWVHENEERILSCAADPIADQWWADADSPWCFLAWCFEFAGYKEQGLDFVSHLPIALDGSCNGIQIFSLLLRDPEGAKAVNVLPSEAPQDVYAMVAERTLQKLKDKAVNGEVEVRRKKVKEYEDEPAVLYNEREEARKWLSWGINRKTTKRQVMVLPYGGTQQSCREYTQEYLEDRIMDARKKGQKLKWDGNPFMGTLFLSNLIWESIGETISSPQIAMRYLQQIAGIVTSEGLPTNWTTPCGMPVMQRYRKLDALRIKTKMGDKIIRMTIQVQTEEIDAARQRSAISPNFVHSLDAAALQRTVTRSVREHGIKDFAMIHDSYGTHAADTPVLARTLREVFVGMFGGEKNLLKEFTDEVLKVVTDPKKLKEVPELPALGSLEVNKVLESEFFFA